MIEERADGSTLVAAFHERSAAETAVRELQGAGFSDEHLGFLSRGAEGEAAREVTPGTTTEGEVPVERSHAAGLLAGTSRGSLTGGAVGGILGALAALVIPGIGPVIAGGVLAGIVAGAVAGGAVGGLTGVLTGMNVPADDAKYYEGEVGRGRTLVAVQPGERRAEAIEILRRNGGYDARSGEAAAAPIATAAEPIATQEPLHRSDSALVEPAPAHDTWDAERHQMETERMQAENERMRLDNERLRLQQEAAGQVDPPHLN